MDYNTIEGAIRNCRYRGWNPLYVVKTPEGKFATVARPTEDTFGRILNVGEQIPDLNPGHTVARVL